MVEQHSAPRRVTNDSTRKAAGDAAEALASDYLASKGLTVIARQFRCRGGELDLVCRDGAAVVFIEVRLRRNTAFGGAAASITATKQGRIIHAARVFLAARPWLAKYDCRFDCVLMDALDPGRIEWLPNAFDAG